MFRGIQQGDPAAAAPGAARRRESLRREFEHLALVPAEKIEEHVREHAGTAIAVLSRQGRPKDPKAALWQVAPESPDDYARQLYAVLRRLDDSGCKKIVVEDLPPLPEWVAIRDRLVRAATPESSKPD